MEPRPVAVLNPLVVIPAWNEEESVQRVIEEIRERLSAQPVLVVNDGSTDRTAAVAAAAGATVLSLPFNSGVGAAMRCGFRFAVRNGYDAVIQVDADGQHDPADIPSLFEAARAGHEVVIGARFAGVGGYTMHGPRRWAATLLSRLLSAMAHTRLTDVTSGFKLYAGDGLALFARDFPEEYLGDTLESLVTATRAKLRITQVPTAMRERAAGSASQSPFGAAGYLARAGLVILLARIRRRPRVPELPTAARPGEPAP